MKALCRHYVVFDFVLPWAFDYCWKHCFWLTTFHFSPPENTRGRKQLRPRFHSGRAHPHTHRWPLDPFHQPGRVSKLLLHFPWTTGELDITSLTQQSSLLPHGVSFFLVQDGSLWHEQSNTVTFLRDMRVQSVWGVSQTHAWQEQGLLSSALS